MSDVPALAGVYNPTFSPDRVRRFFCVYNRSPRIQQSATTQVPAVRWKLDQSDHDES
jgi:hypothetical protein